MEDKIVNIRMKLEGEEATQFLKLKDRRGLRNGTELIRQVLKEAEDKDDQNKRRKKED